MDWSIGNILWTIIGGAIIGILARFFIPGRVPMKLWLTILVGILGMVVGDWLAGLLGVKVTAGIDWTRHFLQIVVAVVGILIVRAFSGRGKASV
jgi:uncharacterized membrane protein YeaQ/YmgE (transglycosylase-associated protein family)